MGGDWEGSGAEVRSNRRMYITEDLARVAATQFGVLTAEQLDLAGFSSTKVSYRVQKGWLLRLPGGVLALAGSADSWHRRASAAALAASRHGGAASHRTAARLWDMRSVDDELEVSVRYPKQLRLPEVIVHRSVDLLPDDITWFEGIPVTTIERTIVDLGLVFPEKEVLRILSHAIATRLVTSGDVRRMRKRVGKSGRDGAGVAGRCLDLIPDLAVEAESGAEVLFLALCETFDLPVPSPQHPVVVGWKHYRLDFAYPLKRVFVEIDGAAYHSSLTQIAADGGRQNDLVASGWHPVRFTYRQLRDSPDFCVDQLRRTLAF